MNLFETLGIATIFSTALVLIIRKLIEQFFSKDLEKFKSELEKELIKHRTKFEILHAERANVIKEVYRKIVKTQRAFESLIKPMQLAGEPTEKEKTKILAYEFNGLASYYTENRLFFNEALAQEIDKLLQKFIEIWNQWGYMKDLQQIGQPNVKEWSKAWDRVKDEIPPIQKAIEDKFRDIIGIN
jgi:hypothetical protein